MLLRTPLGVLDLHSGSKDLELYNIERIRDYLEKNLGCTRKEVSQKLELNSRTVAKAIKIIRKSS